MSFWEELRKRNVIKVAVAYAVVAWLLIQIADTTLPAFGAPSWILPVFILLLAMGFVVALVLSWAYELTPAGVVRADDEPLSVSVAKLTGRKLDFAIIVLLAAVLGYVAFDQYVLEEDEGEAVVQDPSLATRPADDPGAAAPEAAPNVLPNSIGVLPFENLSPNPDDAYFAAGIHEEVLNQLAKLRSLSVISRTSMLRYADSDLSIPEIARELNVETVMEGSVRFANNRVRIVAQLIDAATDEHLWSDVYERDLADVFAIQADVAINIADALQVEFSDAERERVEHPATTSAEAHLLYLRAAQAEGLDLRAADAYVERAIELDREFAEAYALRARINALLMINSYGGTASETDPAELYVLVQELANQALGLDPGLGRAYAALVLAHRIHWHWTEAFEASAHGREADPSFCGTDWTYAFARNHEQSVRNGQCALRLDPKNAYSHYYLGVDYLWARRANEAIAAFEDALALEPTNPIFHNLLGRAHLQLGNRETALRELRISRELWGDEILSVAELAYHYSLLGQTEEALDLVAQFEADAADSENAGDWAMVSLARGDESEALRWLEAAADKARNHVPDAGFFQLMVLRLNEPGDPVLEQPEFVAVRDRLAGD